MDTVVPVAMVFDYQTHDFPVAEAAKVVVANVEAHGEHLLVVAFQLRPELRSC